MEHELEDITGFIRRRIVPTIQGLINEVNLTHGNVVVATADYQIQRVDRVIICQNSSAITVTLPPVADTKGQRFVVCRESAQVTVACQSGEWLYDATDGTIVLGSSWYAAEVYSDGTVYRNMSTVDWAAWFRLGRPRPLWVPYAATLSLDVSAYRDFEIGALTGNCAITLVNGLDGDEGLINVVQDGTGLRTVSIAASGRTTVSSAAIASLAAATTAAAETIYWYRFYADGNGVARLQQSIDFLA